MAEPIPDLPSEKQRDQLVTLLRPLLHVTQPKLYGAENGAKAGSLLVGNHTLYAFLDLPFMMADLWSKHQVTVRGLGDNAHYNFPIWRDLLQVGGMVRGTRENVRSLMDAGENVLVFPGGAREVNKRKGEKYQLIWKERIGFAKLAIEYGYPIIPFAAVGAEDAYDIVLDETNPVYARFTGLVKKVTGWPMQPLARGIGPTLIPRPERLYFWFGEPITTSGYAGDNGDSNARQVRDETKAAVEEGIAFLLREQGEDPQRDLSSRLLKRDSAKPV